METVRSGRKHVLAAMFALIAQCSTAIAQTSTENLEKELVATWLVTVDGEARSRLLTIREVARRPDGTHLLDVTYGYTVGHRVPVWADFVQTSNQNTLNIRTQASSVIVVKQSGPNLFTGTFTTSSGVPKAVSIAKASDEMIRLRVDAEIGEARIGPGFAQENRDWGIASTATTRTNQLRAPTPREIPGAKTITTLELFVSLSAPNAPIMIDVQDGKHVTVREAYWMPGAGGGFGRAEMLRLEAALNKLTAGDKTKPLAFFCKNSECWLSYNAALRALELGYKNVHWYRGGTTAWRAAQFRTKNAAEMAW